jgi:hypothetical protein
LACAPDALAEFDGVIQQRRWLIHISSIQPLRMDA